MKRLTLTGVFLLSVALVATARGGGGGNESPCPACPPTTQDYCATIDFDHSGTIDGDDMGLFIAYFYANTEEQPEALTADLDHDGSIGYGDWVEFIWHYTACTAIVVN